MRYFAYCSASQDIVTTYNIFQVVQDLSSYAKTIYKSHWEEALDNALFHILNNYSEESGDLQHYATRVVGTILLNKYAKEVAHDVALGVGMENKSIEESDTDLAESYVNQQDFMARNNFNECVKYMTPKFIEDFTLFQTGKTNKKKEDYSEIFKKFDSDLIREVREYLLENYEGTILRLRELASTCNLRKITQLRLERSFDETVSFKQVINDIIVYKKGRNQHAKLFYLVDFDELLQKAFEQFYIHNKNFKNHVVIEGYDVFITLSGDIVVGAEALREAVEFELLSETLKKLSPMRIVDYKKGDTLLLSSSREVGETFELEAFGTKLVVPLLRKTSKRYATASA